MTVRWFAILTCAMSVSAGSAAALQQVAEIQVAPTSISLPVGQTQTVLATAYDGSGNPLPTVQIQWRSSNSAVVRVEFDAASPDLANLIGVAPGNAQVEATAGGQRGTVIVQVSGTVGGGATVGTGAPDIVRIDPENILLLPSESRQLAPVFLKNDGSAAAPTVVTWRSLSPTIVTVSDQGMVRAIADGQGLITMTTQNGLEATSAVQVARASLGFSRPILSLSPDMEADLQVVVPSQGNRVLPSVALSWRSTNESVVRVTPLGQARATGPGTAHIIVAGFLQQDTLPVAVHRPVVGLLALPRPSAGPVIVPFGASRQFEVRALAADDTPVPEAPLIWTVADTTIATFRPDSQMLHGLRIGDTEVHLRGPGPDLLEATWTVNVIAGGVLTEPQRVGLGVGDTIALGASFTDTEGNPVAPASQVTWTTSDANVAQVTNSGLVTATGFGHAQIVADVFERLDTTDVFVQGEIVLSSNRAGSLDLYTFDRANPSARNRITSDSAAEAQAAFSPDGSRMAFVTNRDGNAEIYVANGDGSDPVRLTQTPAHEDAPSWTADGSRLVYVAQTPGSRAQIWIMDADGANPRQLTMDSSTNFQPAVSPDGSTVAFTSTRDQNYEIYLMAIDGSNQRNVTQTPAKETMPAWFPDGRLGYIQEQRLGASLSQVVVQKVLATGEITPLSPQDLPVTDFAISPQGDLLILQTTTLDAEGQTIRMYLLPIGGLGGPREIPREGAEQSVYPSFRPLRR